MNPEVLLATILFVCFCCLILEKKIAWLAHVSSVCLIIIVALIAATIGVIPSASPVYDFFLGPAVPIAIGLLILCLNLKDVLRLPPKVLVLWGIGALGSATGSFFAAALGVEALGLDAARLGAQFAASYVGGGENAVAMKEIAQVPQSLFVAGFAVDNLLTSAWMIFTIAISSKSTSQETLMRDYDTKQSLLSEGAFLTLTGILFNFSLVIGLHLFSQWCASAIGVFHPILYLTLFALMVAQVEWIREHLKPAFVLGSALFAPFFFSIGAISNVESLFSLDIVVIVMPAVVVFTHGLVVFVAAKFLGVSRIDAAIVSQSLIGGPATAVAIAQVRNYKGGFHIALIVGLLGYAVGNYVGTGMFYLLQRVLY